MASNCAVAPLNSRKRKASPTVPAPAGGNRCGPTNRVRMNTPVPQGKTATAAVSTQTLVEDAIRTSIAEDTRPSSARTATIATSSSGPCCCHQPQPWSRAGAGPSPVTLSLGWSTKNTLHANRQPAHATETQRHATPVTLTRSCHSGRRVNTKNRPGRAVSVERRRESNPRS
jgi:hypothetical protein